MNHKDGVIKRYLNAHYNALKRGTRLFFSLQQNTPQRVAIVTFANTLFFLFFMLCCTFIPLKKITPLLPTVTIALLTDTTTQNQNKIINQMQISGVFTNIESIAPQNGLREIKKIASFKSVVDNMPRIDLPPLITARINVPTSRMLNVTKTIDALKKMPDVSSVEWSPYWSNLFFSSLRSAYRGLFALGCLLAFLCVWLIDRAINHRDRVQQPSAPLDTLGASSRWIRRPHLYTAFWYGITSTITAALFTDILFRWILSPVLTHTPPLPSRISLMWLALCAFLFCLLSIYTRHPARNP